MIKPMLCKDNLVKFFEHVTYNAHSVLESIKLDGVRCLSTVYRKTGQVVHFSRSGKPFPNFACFNGELRHLAYEMFAQATHPEHMSSFTFDSEVTSQDVNFTSVMQQLRRLKDVDPSVFHMHVMDVVLPDRQLWWRMDKLKEASHALSHTNVSILPHTYVRYPSPVLMEDRLKEVLEQGHEGLVYKVERSFYTSGKSIDWLKMKGVQTLDLRVVGSKPGKGKYEGFIGALLCDYKGVEVAVSGMTGEQRREFTRELPKLIEVEFQGITSKGSLRHPRFVRVREDKVEHD